MLSTFYQRYQFTLQKSRTALSLIPSRKAFPSPHRHLQAQSVLRPDYRFQSVFCSQTLRFPYTASDSFLLRWSRHSNGEFQRNRYLIQHNRQRRICRHLIQKLSFCHLFFQYTFNFLFLICTITIRTRNKMISTAMKAKTAMDYGCFGNIYISFLS